MKNQIRPIRPSEAAGTSWIVAGLISIFGFVLLTRNDWTFIQALFGASIVFVALGLLISLTVGRIKPLSAYPGRPPTREVKTADGIALGVDTSALRPRDLNAPSPHRTTIEPSILSDGKPLKFLGDKGKPRSIFGTVEAAEATRVPAPAPINASDPGVARPVGATTDPKPLEQPAPLDGRVIAHEAPESIDPTRAEAPPVTRNEAAEAAGATARPAPTATPAAQSYNEPGDGADTVEATGDDVAPMADTPAGSFQHAVEGRQKDGPSTPEERTARGDARAHGDSAAQVEADEADPAGAGAAPRAAAPAFGTAPEIGTDTEAEGKKPPTLDAPRGGQGDDFQQIRGIGPKLAEMLNEMGFYHFDQIAAWTDEEVAWVDRNLEGFKGRVSRDEWVPQARTLAAGDRPA
jgi:predicted flap endonuclease-1-like 5' DNA nuclease